MKRIRQVCALILALLVAATAGVFTAFSADDNNSDSAAASNQTATTITIRARQDNVAQLYVYLWNGLPTNDAMSKSYPGEKMIVSDGWFTYTVNNVSKINAIITDADGNQYSKEQKLTAEASKEWWFDNGKWSKYDPDDLDPVTDDDLREESIYFVMTTRFYDGDTGNNVHCWSDGEANNPDSDPAWRGDFKGLAEKLDYIKALGFSAIWVTPVVTNASGYDYHGYHAMDYSTVDYRYESSDFTYEDLIRAVHKKGMKIYQDVVWNHTGNFGETFLCNLFSKDTSKDLSNIKESMIPSDTLLKAYGLNSAEEYWAQNDSVQYQQRLNLMKNLTYSSANGNTTGHYPDNNDYGTNKLSNSNIYNKDNYYHSGYFQSLNWDDWTCKYCQIDGDCVDVNTENTAAAEYTVDAYSKYINMGVDGFRVDTVRHIPRVVLNIMYNNQILDAAKANGKSNFLMFGEICTRYTDVWYRDHAEESSPYYTWKESNPKWAQKWSYGTSVTDIANNMDLTYDHYIEEDDPINQPTSNNAFLNGITYHKPDTSMASGMNAIDFQMHRLFGNAKSAFGIAKSGDKYYNDATYNVVYVDSHDYAPEQPNEKTRFSGGTQTWAEDLDLMFTFRGIPCLYYGSEVEFQKGMDIDVGPKKPLADTGRAYYGDYLDGTVTATDFSKYTASGTVANTLNSPLSQHLMKLNAIRRAVPALQKGQYTTSSNYVSGEMAYIRRYTDDTTDSFACVSVSGGATFKNIPNGKYIDAVTGNVKYVTNGILSVPSMGTANMRVYVCCASGFTGINGQIGDTTTYLK